MYILIKIGKNETHSNIAVSSKKSSLENLIKSEGWYFSKKVGHYINDKSCGIEGGSGIDYIIDTIEVIV